MDDQRAALMTELDLALRSEIGARALYPLLRARARDPQLKDVLASIAKDEVRLVERVAALIEGLGGRARRWSLRRRLASWAIALGTFAFGVRFALRLCQDAEATVARWYGGYRDWFVEQSDLARARECDELMQAKLGHARWLAAWIQNARFRGL